MGWCDEYGFFQKMILLWCIFFFEEQAMDEPDLAGLCVKLCQSLATLHLNSTKVKDTVENTPSTSKQVKLQATEFFGTYENLTSMHTHTNRFSLKYGTETGTNISATISLGWEK